MPETIEELIRRVAAEEGVDPSLALAVARRESGLNAKAVGDEGHSVGLYQLHDRGMGAGMGDARYNPETNARTALRSMSAFARQRPDLAANPGALAAASQRPADAAAYASAINAALGVPSGVGGRIMPDDDSDNELIGEYQRQKTDAEQRLTEAKGKLQDIALARQYQAYLKSHPAQTASAGVLGVGARPGFDPQPGFLAAHPGVNQDDLDRAQQTYADLDPDNVLTGSKTIAQLRQDVQKAQADLNRAGAGLGRAAERAKRGELSGRGRTVVIGDRVMQFNPDSGRYDIDVGPRPSTAAATRVQSQEEAGLYSAQAEHATAQAGLAGAQAGHATAQAEDIRFKLQRAQQVAKWADEGRADLETALKSGDPDQIKSALDRYQEITEPDKALATLEARAEREIRASQERERTAMLVTRLGTAAEVGSLPMGPVRVGQSSAPNVPGAPDESLGLRVLHQMGLDVHPQTGMLTARPRTPPAPTQPEETGTPSAGAVLTSSQSPSTPDQETSGEQGSNLERLLNMTGMLQPQPSPEYATAY